jgi:hypothetical protein
MREVSKRLYSIEEAGEYLGRSKWRVRDMVKTGVIPVVKYDQRVFIDINDMDEMIEASKERRRGKLRQYGKKN